MLSLDEAFMLVLFCGFILSQIVLTIKLRNDD